MKLNYIDSETMYGIWIPYLLISLWLLLYNKRKTIQLRLVADYIANSAICSSENNIRIIIKSHRFGLYDFRKKKVIISPKYSYIHCLDDIHVWIYKKTERGDRYGIYSLKYRRVIANPIYESGSPFINSIATLKLNGQNVLIDVTGNILR